MRDAGTFKSWMLLQLLLYRFMGVETCSGVTAFLTTHMVSIPKPTIRPLSTAISSSESASLVAPLAKGKEEKNNTITKDKKNESEIYNDPMKLFSRAAEVGSIALNTVTPLLVSGLSSTIFSNKSNEKTEGSIVQADESDHDSDRWEKFWSLTSFENDNSHDDIGLPNNADRVVQALQTLGPTYVKFGQALSSRPDIIPKSLADALCTLQDDMDPFDTNIAKNIIVDELLSQPRTREKKSDSDEDNDVPLVQSIKDIQSLIDSLSDEPVAAASVGQVYKGYLPNYGPVAVKVQRPEIKALVEKDYSLLRSVASFVESIPSFGSGNGGDGQRLINTELVAAVDEFMSRIFEELDYTNEANNARQFAQLYSNKGGSRIKSLPNGEGVIVPEIITSLCTKNVLVMEWIEGSKLTTMFSNKESKELKENLKLVEQALYVTLSQLLDTGVMHADPHGGNLLKVFSDEDFSSKASSKDISPTLAYLDFGLLATIPATVRDGLVCSVASLVFAKDVEAVANLFGELDLLPNEVISNPLERKALTDALTKTMEEVLQYPQGESLHALQNKGLARQDKTTVPSLEFDKLLDGLTRLVPRFKFRLPPYFINNARALGTLEGIARGLDPEFNCLKLMYPYALYRLLQNPTGSPVVERTLQNLIRSPETGRIDGEKIAKLLRDSAMFTGYSRRKVLIDILKTKGGKKLILRSLASELNHGVFQRMKNRVKRFSVGKRYSSTTYMRL